jgi:hypothetical protein
VTSLEDRLRRDLRAAGNRARPGMIRPLRAPDQALRHGVAREHSAARRRRIVRIVAPVKAAVAVVGIITGVTLSGVGTGRSLQHNSGPVVAQMLPGKMPPYYVIATNGVRDHRAVITATVRSSATGAVLSSTLVWRATSTKPPKGLLPYFGDSASVTGITADASDRIFAIGTSAGDFLLRLSADGRSGRVTRIPSVHTDDLNWLQIALSPSGTELAIDITYSPGRKHLDNPGIEVLSLKTGATRMWVQHTGGRLFMGNIAWAPDGKQIAFQWGSGYGLLDLAGTPSGPRRLPVRGAGDVLFANSVYAASLNLITTKAHLVTHPVGRATEVMQIVEMKSLAGGLRRVLYQYSAAYHGTRMNGGLGGELARDCQVLAEAQRGVHALIACPQFGRLDGGKFTPLPGVPPATGNELLIGPVPIGYNVAW